MALTENFKIKRRLDLTEKELEKADAFILKDSTTGEFINTFNYMGYHPQERFIDDSIVIMDYGSGEIKGVMLAACTGENCIMSHPGTTFAGPVIDRNVNLETAEAVLNLMFGYYEKRYHKIIIEKIPEYYTSQPFHLIDYFLLQRGYFYAMSALTNVINIRQIASETDAYTLFDSKKRNQVRKAVKAGRFIFSSENDVRKDVWDSMNENLRRKFDSKTTHTLEEIRELKNRCPRHIKAYYVDTKEGEYGAFALIYLFKNVFHTQYLDVNYKYTGQYPNLLLIFELLMEARRMGYDYFSFGASTENRGAVINRGLYHYKAGYGGGDIILPVYTKLV